MKSTKTTASKTKPTARKTKTATTKSTAQIEPTNETTTPAASPSSNEPSTTTQTPNLDTGLVLTPQEYEAITKANSNHPLKQLTLRMFLFINHTHHVARFMQHKDESLFRSIDWQSLEYNARNILQAALPNMLEGIDPTPWEPEEEDESEELTHYQSWQRTQDRLRKINRVRL